MIYSILKVFFFIVNDKKDSLAQKKEFDSYDYNLKMFHQIGIFL